jgi:hypothetical protein
LKNSIFVFLATILASSCVSLKPAGSGAKTSADVYEEDLSTVRPRYDIKEIEQIKIITSPEEPIETTGEVKLHVNKDVIAILDSMGARNKAVKYTDGFRIQLYVGNVRADMEAAKLFSYQVQPGVSPYASFNQPTYRLKVGDFLTRQQAEKYLSYYKPTYVTATVVSDKIEIKRALELK